MQLIKSLIFFISAAIAIHVQGQASATGKKYSEQIVFSKNPIQSGSENESAFITQYEPGGELYYHVYMSNTVQGLIDKWKYSTSPLSKFKYLFVKIYIDDTYTAGVTKKLQAVPDEQFKNMRDFGSALWSAKETDSDPFSLNKDFKDFMAANTAKLSGSHQVKIEIQMYDNTHVYETYGTGTLTIKGGANMSADMSGIKNEFHRQHFNKVVFGSKPLGAELTVSELITSYTVGQPLYYRVFMDNTIENIKKKYEYANSYEQIYCFFYIDGIKVKEDRFANFCNLNKGGDGYKNMTTVGGMMMSDQKVDGDKEQFLLLHAFLNFLLTNNKQLEGTHKVKMELYLYGQGINKTAEKLGEGELNVTMGAVSKSNPNLCYTQTAVMSDPALEAKFIAAYNEQSKGAATAKKAYLNYKEWDVRKNEVTGAILSKYRNAILLIETATGSCSYQEICFAMDYEGNGKYGYIHFSGLVPGGYRHILCDCLK